MRRDRRNKEGKQKIKSEKRQRDKSWRSRDPNQSLTELARGGVDLLNPYGTIIALFGAAVTIGVSERFVDTIGCDAVIILATAPVAFRELENHRPLHLRSERESLRPSDHLEDLQLLSSKPSLDSFRSHKLR